MTGTDSPEAGDVLVPELPPLPYPGLRPFADSEWPIFFGREQVTEEVVGKLLRQSVVCLHGTSGCGKSSLVRAGINAVLQQEHIRKGVTWRTCSMRPGDAPLENLAQALAGMHAGTDAIEIRRRLNRGRNAAAALLPIIRPDPSERICVVMDQFEELFRFARHVNPDEATLFVDVLLGLVHQRPEGLFALVTMRSEFLGECARFEGLPEAFNETQFLLPRMTKPDLVRAIQEPASLYGGQVDDELAAHMIADVGESPDELPLIQHALMLLWQAASDRRVPASSPVRLTTAMYQERGSLFSLLSDHADEVAQSQSGEGRPDDHAVEGVFRALTDINAEGVATRRPQVLRDLVMTVGVAEERVRAILDAFRADGVSFVTPYAPAPLEGDTVVDVSHEALIRCWTAIAALRDGWLHREFSDGLIWRSLLVQADGFERNRSNVLSAAATEEWEPWFAARTAAWAGRYGGRWDDVSKLLQASRRAVEQKQLQERNRRISRLSFDQGAARLPELVIRPVHAELLRPGPPHNQLLSPLTTYLAIAGDAGAGVVSVPYEHAEFERRLKELRYETGDEADRLGMLHTTGVEMGKLLGSIPGLAGALSADSAQPGLLVHLRLTLSASELAYLPFELAKSPASPTTTGESWMCIQTRPLVCVTRNVRTVSPEGVVWPDRPRVLFISAHPDLVPFEEHYTALLQAIDPFRLPKRDDPVRTEDRAREQFGDLLTVLIDPSLTDVLRECHDQRYTHVHILAHGDRDISSHQSYGLVLRGPDGSADVVSGERLASALATVDEGRVHRPTVVTIASCDSGNVGSVIIPGASFAHALHQSGIPLIVASQFPLSKEGSVPLAARVYDGLLWGRHPLLLLQQVRAELHARYTATRHDWASLVVYEALPQTLTEQLDALRYAQSRRALNAVLARVEQAVIEDQGAHPAPDSLHHLQRAVDVAVGSLPMSGRFAADSIGLRASAWKRLAQASFILATRAANDALRPGKGSFELLDDALRDYELAARGLLVPSYELAQRVATLHWVLVQIESLSLALGRECSETRWHAAKLSADLYCEHVSVDERAWAHASLAELWLIRLGSVDLTDNERRQCSAFAEEEIQELTRLYPWGDEFPILSTRRQFQRYTDWWGTDRFERDLRDRGVQRRISWRGGIDLLATARKLLARLERPDSARHDAPPASQGVPVPQVRPARTVRGATQPSAERAPGAPVLAGPSGTRLRGTPTFDIELFPAQHGDALWIQYGNGRSVHRVLVDCGTETTGRLLVERVESLAPEQKQLELFVLSHIDSDHIGGALPFFQSVQRGLTIGDVWFNGWRHISGQLGSRQGEMFSTAIRDFDLPWNMWREGAAVVVGEGELPVHILPGGMRLTLLSPRRMQLQKLAPVWTRELKRNGLEPGSRVDYSRFLKGKPSTSTDVDVLAAAAFEGDNGMPNGSSIALLAEFEGAAILLGADAHAPVLAESIRALLAVRGQTRLTLDAFKVSHHGSQNNVSRELIELIDCRRFLISTNGSHFNHPDREAIARIIKYGGKHPVLHFNYRSRFNEVWARPDLQERYQYSAIYPEEGREGAIASLLGAHR